MEPTRKEIDYWIDLFGEPLNEITSENGKYQISAYLDKLELELAKAKGQQPLDFGGEI